MSIQRKHGFWAWYCLAIWITGIIGTLMFISYVFVNQRFPFFGFRLATTKSQIITSLVVLFLAFISQGAFAIWAAALAMPEYIFAGMKTLPNWTWVYLLLAATSVLAAREITNMTLEEFIFPAIEKKHMSRAIEAGSSQQRPEVKRTPSVAIEKDPKAFDKLIGVDGAIQEFKNALELPIHHPDLIKEYGIEPVTGILLYGPPGTGKTSLARAAAAYFGLPFIYKKTSEFSDRWVGSSEANVRQLFATARQKGKEQNTRCIIFLDEIDSIARVRDGKHMNRPSDLILNTLLEEMDGFEKNNTVMLIAATNRLDVLDPALVRPGRINKLIEVGLPDENARIKLFEFYLKDAPINKSDSIVDPQAYHDFLNYCAAETNGISPAEIKEICQAAKVKAATREARGGEKGVKSEDIKEGIREWLKRKVSENQL